MKSRMKTGLERLFVGAVSHVVISAWLVKITGIAFDGPTWRDGFASTNRTPTMRPLRLRRSESMNPVIGFIH